MRRGRHRKKSRAWMAGLLFASQLVLLLPISAGAAPVVVVNSTGDASDSNPGDSVCDTGGPDVGTADECTFRAALEEANATGAVDTIHFGIPTTDPGHSGGIFTISPATVYPSVGSRITISGATQPGFSGAPVVVLDGSSVGNISSGTDGLLITGNRVTVRSLTIKDFPDDGIEIHGDRNNIYGNHVVGNDVGILVEEADRNTIGGTSAADRNVIYGNDSHGISIDEGDRNTVVGNYIGVDASMSSSGNDGHGVYVWEESTRTEIRLNVISANDGDGVALDNDSDTTRTVILSNSIYGNAGLGIDLANNGPSANDAGDGDSGPNTLQNHPTISAAVAVGSSTTVDFALDTQNGRYRVEFFTNPSGTDPSGYGEGQQLAGSTIVHKTGSNSSFTHTVTASAGDVLTATATRCNNAACNNPRYTSEFSPTFTVVPSNYAPVLDHIDNANVDEDDTLTFTATASDPDTGDSLTFSLDGEPTGAVIDPNTGFFSWTPTEAQAPYGFTFDVVVTDDGTPVMSDRQSITITTGEVNVAPVLANPGNHTIDEQAPFTFTASATDTDLPANTITYSLDGEPTGANINPNTGVFTWTPTEAQGPNSYTFDITATDNGTPSHSDTKTITLTVEETNQAPNVTNPGNQADAEGDTVNLAIVATDNDIPTNTLTYHATGLPPGLTINPNTGQITGTISYDASPNSPYTTTITVTDHHGATDTATFGWTTPNTNRGPDVDAVPQLSVTEQTQLTRGVVASDPDGDSLLFTISGQPAGLTIDQGAGVFTWTPTEAQGPGTYTFEVSTKDAGSPSYEVTRTVRITVAESNKPPIAGNDSIGTLEDQAVTIPVLANDSDVDLPANKLSIVSTGKPNGGGTVRIVGNELVYTPSAHFHGPVSFAYTLTDGTASVSAIVNVSVASVNDVPVAGDDSYRLADYQPTDLPVLNNDHDADEEPLTLSIVEPPAVGKLTLHSDKVVYDPDNRWTGQVTFRYRITDPQGTSDEATVKVLVGDEVLVGARELAGELGVDNTTFEPPAPQFDATSLRLLDMDGITLLADSFFQTVSALRVPLGFLGVAVALIVGFGTTSKVPPLVFGIRRRHHSVVRLGRQQRLPAYSEPGGRRVVYNYDPTAAGIVSTGRPQKVGSSEWLPIDTPNGAGYLFSKYLTEQVDLRAFAQDQRPVKLVHQLADALERGKDITSFVSDEGLMVSLTGATTRIPAEHLTELVTAQRIRRLPTAGQTVGTPDGFYAAVTEPFLEAYGKTDEITAETPHSRSALIPTEVWNFPYLAVGTRQASQPWLVFFEYKKGRAYIAGLGIDE